MASSLLTRSPSCSTRSSSLVESCQLRQGRKTGDLTSTFVPSLVASSPVRSRRALVCMAAESGDSSASSDQGNISVPGTSASKVVLPPRLCTLREFGQGMVASDSDAKVSTFFQLLSANIELSYKVQDWEILSGRLAMMVFVSALLLEATTGNSVFQKMDTQRLLEISAAIFASVIVAAGLAVALQAKTRVAYSVSKGYERMMNALIDNVFDSLLFNTDDA